MIRKNCAVLALFFVGAQAFANAAVCPSIASQNKEISICEDNFVFGTYSASCLRKVKEDVLASKARIQKFLAANTSAQEGKQNKSYDTADSNYSDLKKELDTMIANVTQAKATVDGYLPELFFPEDYDNPAITRMSPTAYLNSEPCFAIPRNIINDASRTLASIVDDYTKTRDSAFGKAIVSKDSSENVKQGAADAKVLHSGAAHAPSAKGIEAGGSTVTNSTRKAQPQSK